MNRMFLQALPTAVACLTVLTSATSVVAAVVVHVSPEGDDRNAGTEAAPLATFLEARDTVRRRRQAGEGGDGPIAVIIHGGVYRITATLTLAAQDSGTEQIPVIWRAAPSCSSTTGT